MSKRPFYLTPTFQAQQRQWRLILKETGFVDAESPNALYLNDDHGRSILHLEHMATDLQERELSKGNNILQAQRDMDSPAEQALNTPEFWEDLPLKCRRLISLMVHQSWQCGTAAKLLQISNHQARQFITQVTEKLEAQRKAT